MGALAQQYWGREKMDSWSPNQGCAGYWIPCPGAVFRESLTRPEKIPGYLVSQIPGPELSLPHTLGPNVDPNLGSSEANQIYSIAKFKNENTIKRDKNYKIKNCETLNFLCNNLQLQAALSSTFER